MFIPEEAFVKILKPGSIYYFIDKKVSSSVPHYFVIINQDIQSSPILVLPVSTTQIESRKTYYQYSGVNMECLVEVTPQDVNNLLPRCSAFDCNSAVDITTERFYQKFIAGELEYIWIIPDDVLEKLRKGVKLSRNIEKWIQELV